MKRKRYSKDVEECVLQAEQAVEEFLKEIDASKLVVYTGINLKDWWGSNSGYLATVVTKAIQALGSHVYHFNESHELLEKIQTAPPDLVIVQIGFSDTTGLSFVDLLGDDLRTRMLPVLVLTRLGTTVEFEAKDRDRCLLWLHEYIYHTYLQRDVLGFLNYCKRKQKNTPPG